MENKIKVSVYGNKLSMLGKESDCGHKVGHSCTGCGCKEKKNVGDMFLELEKFILVSDINNKVQLQFIELDKNRIGGNEEIEEIIERGFESPIVVIDGIIRYYGGISNLLVYNDIKELLS